MEKKEDITANLKTIKDIPQNIKAQNFPEEIDIRGEVFIEKNFWKIKEKFANAEMLPLKFKTKRSI